MTNYRKELLDKVANTEGLEAPMTIAIFRMSDLYPKSCHDNMIADLYTVLRSVETFYEEQEEQDDLPKDNMNEDADAYEDIINETYEMLGWDE